MAVRVVLEILCEDDLAVELKDSGSVASVFLRSLVGHLDHSVVSAEPTTDRVLAGNVASPDLTWLDVWLTEQLGPRVVH